MEVLVQSLQSFVPPEYSGYSLVPSDQAVDLSLKSNKSTTIVSLATKISSFGSFVQAIPPVPVTVAHKLCEDDSSSADEQESFESEVDVENDEGEKGTSQKISEETLEIMSLRRSLPQLDEMAELHCKVGEGTFSSVYLATARQNPSVRLAVKHLTPTCHPSRIKRELECLRNIGGQDNVSGLLQCLRHNGCVAFVMHYQPHQRFQDYVLDMDTTETRFYMYNLLIALKRVHSFGIIHRDVKPGNFLYDRTNKKFMLVDFGLAQKLDSPALNPDQTPAQTSNASETSPSTSTNKEQPKVQFVKSVESKKRKRNEENSNQLHPILEPAAKRRALVPQNDNQKNIIVPFKIPPALPKIASQFQQLMPGQSTSTQPPSYVRVQNSRVKMLSAPMQSGNNNNNNRPRCQCLGKPQICDSCLKRKKLVAARAGTPGFRPPEVLLKSIQQTTAVDMWAAGVLLLSILSGCYPFFKSPDDMTALAELMTIFGTKPMREIAAKLNRMLVMDKERAPLDLKKMCIKLRNNRLAAREKKSRKSEDRGKSGQKCPVCGPSLHSNSEEIPCLCKGSHGTSTPQFPDEAYDLLHKLLDLNPSTRITAEQALEHPFIKSMQ